MPGEAATDANPPFPKERLREVRRRIGERVYSKPKNSGPRSRMHESSVTYGSSIPGICWKTALGTGGGGSTSLRIQIPVFNVNASCDEAELSIEMTTSARYCWNMPQPLLRLLWHGIFYNEYPVRVPDFEFKSCTR